MNGEKFFLLSKSVQGVIVMILGVAFNHFDIAVAGDLSDIVNNVAVAIGTLWFTVGSFSKKRAPLSVTPGS